MSTKRIDANKLKFIQLVDRLEAGGKKEFGTNSPLLLEPYIRKISVPTLRMEPVRPHRFQELNLLVTAMLLEQDLYRNDQIDRLELLRKVTFGGKRTNAFAIDGMTKHLPDFSELRTISVENKHLVTPLSFYISFKRVKDHLEQAGFDVVESKDKRGRDRLEVTSPTGGKFTINHTMISFDHSACEQYPAEFDEGLTRFVEFLCLLPFERKNWSLGGNTVYLNELRPILDMMFKIENNTLGDTFSNISGIITNGDISDSEYFKETQRSEILRKKGVRDDSEKAYSLDKKYLPEHINFIVVKENKDRLPSIIIETDCHLNIPEIEAELGKIEGSKLFVTTPKTKKQRKVGFVNKGNRIEVKTSYQRSQESIIIDEDRNLVATIKTPGTIFVPVNEQTKDAAVKLLDIIYDKKLFYTPKIRDTEMGDTRLTDIERQVVNAFDSLMEIYRYFLETDHYKKAWEIARETGAMEMDIVTSRDWILGKMKESERKDLPGRVLNVLQAMDAEIDPTDFGKYGTAVDTLKQINELYSTLQNLKGRFEAICEATPEIK